MATIIIIINIFSVISAKRRFCRPEKKDQGGGGGLLIRAMPELKPLFSIDVFPKIVLVKGHRKNADEGWQMGVGGDKRWRLGGGSGNTQIWLKWYLILMLLMKMYEIWGSLISTTAWIRIKPVKSIQLLREAPPRENLCSFGHCPFGGGGLNPCQDGLWHLFLGEMSMYKRPFAWFCPKIGATECPFECGGGG